MNRYWAQGLRVEPSSPHDGDESWFADGLVTVAGHAFPPRFRIWMRCNATGADMCIALEIDRGGFIEPENTTTVSGAASDGEKDLIRSGARRLAVPLALAGMPYGPVRRTESGWQWAAAQWAPPPIGRLSDAMPGAQLTLVKELRRRTGAKWWSIYLPRIEATAQIVWDAPDNMSIRQVIKDRVCPGTRVERATAYQDLRTARELGLLPTTRELHL
ncbi:hypothetical protein [Streptomyces sp. NPDC051214]|uniref:hypothetical protein n=1 Tax=Streptomyces sp. NPDC051214 TaxID=3155282 RepID=UPI003414B1D1